MAYLLDANVFIQAKNLHYGLDFCPAFWDWLVRAHAAGTVISIEMVGDEFTAGTDALAEWAAERGATFFVPPDPQVEPALRRVSAWVASQPNYEPAAVSTFLQKADHMVVAHALAHGHTVVTHEKPENSRRTVKIPSPCVALDVKYMTPYQMLRHERARFVLGQHP
jgi:hypothetical protein